MATKELFKDDFKIGGDGATGNVSLAADAGLLQAKVAVSFPIIKILTPVADALKKLIPGEKYDKYVDDALEAALKALGIDPAPALPEPEEPAPQT